MSLTQWLVYRRDDRGFRAEQVEGPYYRGPRVWDTIDRHWKSTEANALTDYLWSRGAWKKVLTRDDDQAPTREAWERFAWGDLIHGTLLHLATRTAAKQLVQSPCFDLWGLDDAELARAATDVSAAVCGSPRRVRATCPTLGLQVEGSVVSLAPGIQIRSWSTEERCEFLTLHHEEYLSGDFTGWFSDGALEVDVDVHALDDETTATAVAGVIDTVKWATEIAANRGTTFRESPTIIETSSGWRGITLRRTSTIRRVDSWPVLKLGPNEMHTVAGLMNGVRDIRTLSHHIDDAIWLYGRSCNAVLQRDALLDAAVGLEMLLVPNPGESRYRFTLHALAILDTDPDAQLEKDLKAIYAGRSVAAHGGDVTRTFDALAPRARGILARVIAAIVALQQSGLLDVRSTGGDVPVAVERLVKGRVRK